MGEEPGTLARETTTAHLELEDRKPPHRPFRERRLDGGSSADPAARPNPDERPKRVEICRSPAVPSLTAPGQKQSVGAVRSSGRSGFSMRRWALYYSDGEPSVE